MIDSHVRRLIVRVAAAGHPEDHHPGGDAGSCRARSTNKTTRNLRVFAHLSAIKTAGILDKRLQPIMVGEVEV
jgi:hypothetical protein